jgi:hypothetical protein
MKVNKMEFELIDECEIEYSRGNGSSKKTPSLFDTPLSDRTYWGNDAGTELTMALARNRIRKSIKNLKLMDIDDDDLTRILLKEYRDELRIYQLEILKELIMENVVVVVQNSVGEWELEIVSA